MLADRLDARLRSVVLVFKTFGVDHGVRSHVGGSVARSLVVHGETLLHRARLQRPLVGGSLQAAVRPVDLLTCNSARVVLVHSHALLDLVELPVVWLLVESSHVSFR